MTMPAGSESASLGWPTDQMFGGFASARDTDATGRLTRVMRFPPSYEYPIPGSQEQTIGLFNAGPAATGLAVALDNPISAGQLWTVPQANWGRINRIDFAVNVAVAYTGTGFFSVEVNGQKIAGYDKILVLPTSPLPATQTVIAFTLAPYILLRPAGVQRVMVRYTNFNAAASATNVYAQIYGWTWPDSLDAFWYDHGAAR